MFSISERCRKNLTFLERIYLWRVGTVKEHGETWRKGLLQVRYYTRPWAQWVTVFFSISRVNNATLSLRYWAADRPVSQQVQYQPVRMFCSYFSSGVRCCHQWSVIAQRSCTPAPAVSWTYYPANGRFIGLVLPWKNTRLQEVVEVLNWVQEVLKPGELTDETKHLLSITVCHKHSCCSIDYQP